MLNQLLVGRYRVVEVLGQGGLAQTYIAIDQYQPSRPKCAVKLLKPASKDSSFLPIARRLFVTEAEILEKLGRHNQIPQLLAHFEEKKEFFIIQEYIEGNTLGTELPFGHRWTENKVILMLQDVLKTLEFVHSYGVIHRDIKPNNLIRRDEDGQIVLIDFGAVKQVGDSRITTKMPLTPKTISIGTQGYMPTEQARGKPRLNSDIYALGMIGIQALTGIDPFNLEENIEGEVIWRDYAQVSDELAAILNRMVRYHFRDRYQSTTEVLQALETLKSHSLVTTKNSQESVIALPESEFRETRVSLSNEPSEVRATSHARSEKIEVSQDISQPISREDPLVEVRETKVSLDSEHSDQKVSSEPELEQVTKPQQGDAWSSWENQDTPLEVKQANSIEVAQDINQPISREDPLLELRETKVSLDSEHSDQKVSSEPELEQVTKPQQGDAWIFWENQDTSVDLKSQKTPPEVKQANSVVTDSEKQKVTSGLLEIDSWGEWNSETVAKSGKNKTNQQKSLKSNDLELETAPQIDAQKSKAIQNIQEKKQELDIKPPIKETKISQGNERLNPKAASQISPKETRISLSNEQNEPVVSTPKSKKTKTSRPNNQSASNAAAKFAEKETKLSLSSEAQDTSNISNIETIKAQLILSIRQPRLLIDKRKIDKVFNFILTKTSLIRLRFSRVKPHAFLVRNKRYSLLTGMGTILALLSYVGYKYISHRHSYKQLKSDLAIIEQLEADKEYQECIKKAISFSNKFSDLSIQKNFLLSNCYQGQLTTATKLAQESRYEAAINLVIQIPQDQDIYAESQKLITKWSENIYEIATNKYQEGNLKNAIAFLQAIPDNSPLSKEIQTTSKQWQADWEQNRTRIQAAQKGLDEKRWQDAINEAKKIENNPNNRYWLDQSDEIIKKANAAIAAAEAAARNPYRSPSRSSYGSNSNTNSSSVTPINPVIPPSPLPSPVPTESSNSTEPNEPDRLPAVCLNKHSPIPKCRNRRK